MLLSLNTRQVGRVTVVRCHGKIVSGSETDSLHTHVTYLLRDRRSILLHLGDVAFIDSSGLGTIVRALANTRQVRGDLKLCNVPPHVRRVLDVTCLSKMFELHDSEENALAAFYQPSAHSEAPAPLGKNILCFGGDLNVLAYQRELLRGAGYEVQTASLVNDARLLLRVTKVDLLLLSAEKAEAMAASEAVRDAFARVPILELDREFATRCAGEAGTELLAMIATRLNPQLS